MVWQLCQISLMEGWCMYKCTDTYAAFYQNNEVFSRLLLNLWPKAYEYIVCLASVQLFYSINFYQKIMIYTFWKTLKKFWFWCKIFPIFLRITIIMENKFCKTISITDIDPLTSIPFLVSSFGSKFNKLASETIVLAVTDELNNTFH